MNLIITRSKREYPDTNEPPENESEKARVESVALQALGSNNNNDSGTPSASKKMKIVVEIFDMPKETIFEILRYLPAKDLIRFSQASRTARIFAREFLSLISDFKNILSISKPESKSFLEFQAGNNLPLSIQFSDNYHLQFGSLIRLLNRSKEELVQMMQGLPELLEIKTNPGENSYIRNIHSLLVRAIFGGDRKVDEKSMSSDRLSFFLTRLLELYNRTPVVNEVIINYNLLVYIEKNFRLIFKYVELNNIHLLIDCFIKAKIRYPVSDLVKDCETFERRIKFLEALWNHQIISYENKCTFTDSNGQETEIIRFQGAFYTAVGLLNGKGSLKDHKENVFKGEFQDGKPINGSGILYRGIITFDLEVYAVFEGSLKNGKPDGNVIIRDFENEMFYGFYKEGFPYAGMGSIRNDDGHIFVFASTTGNQWSQVRRISFYPNEDEWTAPEGEEEYKDIGTLGTLGTFLYGNEDTYVGELKNFRPNGKGKRTGRNGEFVEGEFEDAVFLQGHASILSKNKSRYVGQLKYNMKHGQGTLNHADGSVYIGSFENDKKSGHGTLTLPQGDIYEGEFKGGKASGQGTLKYADGSVYKGSFENGNQSGHGTLTLPKGDIYEGELKDGKASGQGTLKYADGRFYIGGFEKGERHGKGTLTFPKGNSYVGEFKNGAFSGQGTLKYADGVFYIGGFEKGERSGHGTLTFPSGDIYEGEFKDGELRGQGTVKYADGREYKGNFVNGNQSGDGTLTFPNGDIYKGKFKDGEFSGKGTLTFHIGDRYQGEFQNNKRHGQGRFKYAIGCVYEGGFENNLQSGYGILTYPKGGRYEGAFKNDDFNGEGIFYYADGSVYKGGFKNCEFSGYGTLRYPDGKTYEGEFENDKFHGIGILRYPDGSVYTGEFKNDEYSGYGTLTFLDGYVYTGFFNNGVRDGVFSIQPPDRESYEIEYKDGKLWKGIFRGYQPDGTVLIKKYQNGQEVLINEDDY